MVLWICEKVRLTDERADDGSHIVYVNAEYADTDTSAIGKLMKDFMTADPAQIQNELLRERMTYFKLTEEGREKMCQVMEEIVKEENKRRDITVAAEMVRAGKLTEAEITRFFDIPPVEAARIYLENSPSQ